MDNLTSLIVDLVVQGVPLDEAVEQATRTLANDNCMAQTKGE